MGNVHLPDTSRASMADEMPTNKGFTDAELSMISELRRNLEPMASDSACGPG